MTWQAKAFGRDFATGGMESPFEVLQIDPDADEREIERAYKRLVKDAHPDHGGSVREFQRVRAAYEAAKSGDWSADREATRADLEANPRQAGERTNGESQQTVARVEYLNYDVLDDHGWALDDDDLFEKAAAEDLDPTDRGRFVVESGESLLEAAENRGFTWPYACRGGACANCAVAVVDGDLSMPVNHILPAEMSDRGVRLSCVGAPTTDELRVVYNIKHLPDLEDLRLPPGPFRQAGRGD